MITLCAKSYLMRKISYREHAKHGHTVCERKYVPPPLTKQSCTAPRNFTSC